MPMEGALSYSQAMAVTDAFEFKQLSLSRAWRRVAIEECCRLRLR